MRHWAICSSLLALTAATGEAQQRLTQPEALQLAFPGETAVERRTAYLDDAALAAVRAEAGSDVEVNQRVITYYVGTRAGRPVAAAWFDGHLVRSKEEVIMVVVDPAGRIRLVEVLRFDEPPEYRAPDRWLDQLEGKTLDGGLSLKGSIINLTGATLTSRALVRSTRRMLALHRVLQPFGRKP